MVSTDSRSLVPAFAAGGAPPQAGPGNVIRPSRTPNRWHLRNWRMRWRVLALVLIPTVAALTLGALRVQAASDTAATASRTARLGALGSDVTTLAEAVEDERDLTAGYVAARQAGQTPLKATILRGLKQQYAVTSAGHGHRQGPGRADQRVLPDRRRLRPLLRPEQPVRAARAAPAV